MIDIRDQPVPGDYSCSSIADFLRGRREVEPHNHFLFSKLQYFPRVGDESQFYPITLRDDTGEIDARVCYHEKGAEGENLVERLRGISGGQDIMLPVDRDNVCLDHGEDVNQAAFYLVLFTLHRPPRTKGERKGFREMLKELVSRRVMAPRLI